MKKFYISILFILITNLVFCQVIENYRENVILNSDRNTYITGEIIQFSALVSNNQQELLSQIIYIELITPKGKQIKGVKYKIKESVVCGQLNIPSNIYNGFYYLRAYTKYMRNFGSAAYDYQMIKIINPNQENILNEPNGEDTIKYKLVQTEESRDISIEFNKDTFGLREKVNLTIENKSSNNFSNITTSVVPLSTSYLHDIKPPAYQKTISKFYPETKGISLSGILKDESNDQPLVQKNVNLTILHRDKNLFFSTYTNSKGGFYFALPDLMGKKDIFISPEQVPEAKPKLFIHNDFCTNPVNLPTPDFNLNDNEKETIYKLAVNTQVHKNFYEIAADDTINHHFLLKDSMPFYGQPTHTLKLDNYIELATLEDYLKEISFPLKIRENKKKKRFKLIGSHPELNIYEPLIMVDLVPVYNVNDILAIPPSKIDRIEVVTSPYIKGDIKYGGLVNFITRTNDLGGVKLPDKGMFLNFIFLENKKSTKSKYKIAKSDLIPDARNTLYWNTELQLKANALTKISFNTGDTNETYIIIIKGITKKGKQVISTKTFSVK